MVQIRSGDHSLNHISANRDAMLMMRKRHYIGIPTGRLSILKLGRVFPLLSRLMQSQLAKSLITLTPLTSAFPLPYQSVLALHGTTNSPGLRRQALLKLRLSTRY